VNHSNSSTTKIKIIIVIKPSGANAGCSMGKREVILRNLSKDALKWQVSLVDNPQIHSYWGYITAQLKITSLSLPAG
jgi:hypothetical protein